MSVRRVRDWLRSKNEEVAEGCFQYSSGDFNDMANQLDAELRFAPGEDPREVAMRQAERRERIATAALHGHLAWAGMWQEGCSSQITQAVKAACTYADALIAELDRQPEGGTG